MTNKRFKVWVEIEEVDDDGDTVDAGHSLNLLAGSAVFETDDLDEAARFGNLVQDLAGNANGIKTAVDGRGAWLKNNEYPGDSGRRDAYWDETSMDWLECIADEAIRAVWKGSV